MTVMAPVGETERIPLKMNKSKKVKHHNLEAKGKNYTLTAGYLKPGTPAFVPGNIKIGKPLIFVGSAKVWDTLLRTRRPPNFPSLSKCEAVVRKSLSDHKLTDNDRHIIGTLWAYMERELS